MAADNDTRSRLLQAARACLLTEGYARLSTRRIADAAGVPLSQIHYHFQGKQGLVLALLAGENERLLERQRSMYGAEVPLWKRYEQACDFLEDDLASGYVRVLQEMVAAGWSDRVVAREVLDLVHQWFAVLEEVAKEADERLGSLGPFSAVELATLVGLSFLGAETVILLGEESFSRSVNAALRRLADVIRQLEEA
jgi:AcrR family transcriptional regulator